MPRSHLRQLAVASPKWGEAGGRGLLIAAAEAEAVARGLLLKVPVTRLTPGAPGR
jgi:hypothetical protein